MQYLLKCCRFSGHLSRVGASAEEPSRQPLRYNFMTFVVTLSIDLTEIVYLIRLFKRQPSTCFTIESPSINIFFLGGFTAQKMKFSIKDFFSKCDQIRRKLQIWSHLLEKSLTENLTFCAVITEP